MYADHETTLKKRYHAAYTSDIENVALARRAIARFATECGFSEGAVSDIRLAAGEALSNAVEHGCETSDRSFSVDCDFDGEELAIVVGDSGHGFPEPSHTTSIEPDARGRGFGIFLMRRLMDEVSFGRNGSVVRLVRRHS